jgi:hypothetical protein
LELRRIRRRAGKSVAAECQRLVREWLVGHRGLFVALGVIAVVAAVGAIWVSYPDVWVMLVGVFAGCAICLFIAVWQSPPQWIENYLQGVWGEQNTARAGEPLLRSGWVAVHDLSRVSYNLDHVLIGPAGVFLLDSKNLGGTARMDSDQLTLTRPGTSRGRYTVANFARSAVAQAVELNGILRKRHGRRVWVTAVVVIWGEFPQREAAGRHVHYVHGDELVNWLRHRPAPLNAHEIEDIATALRSGQHRPEEVTVTGAAGAGPVSPVDGHTP